MSFKHLSLDVFLAPAGPAASHNSPHPAKNPSFQASKIRSEVGLKVEKRLFGVFSMVFGVFSKVFYGFL